MGDIKSHIMMVDAYDGTLESETEFNAVTGLVNMHAMWKKTRRRWKNGMPWIAYFEYMEWHNDATLCVFA